MSMRKHNRNLPARPVSIIVVRRNLASIVITQTHQKEQAYTAIKFLNNPLEVLS